MQRLIAGCSPSRQNLGEGVGEGLSTGTGDVVGEVVGLGSIGEDGLGVGVAILVVGSQTARPGLIWFELSSRSIEGVVNEGIREPPGR
jgi:hypothetical protein